MLTNALASVPKLQALHLIELIDWYMLACGF
jgi:hypothetical protein